MEKKDIVIIAAVIVFSGYSLYRRYVMKKPGVQGSGSLKLPAKNSLKDQADDYEPYVTGKKNQE